MMHSLRHGNVLDYSCKQTHAIGVELCQTKRHQCSVMIALCRVSFSLNVHFKRKSGFLFHPCKSDNSSDGVSAAHFNSCPAWLLWAMYNIPYSCKSAPFLSENVRHKARTVWQINCTMAPSLFCGTHAICVRISSLWIEQSHQIFPLKWRVFTADCVCLGFVFSLSNIPVKTEFMQFYDFVDFMNNKFCFYSFF